MDLFQYASLNGAKKAGKPSPPPPETYQAAHDLFRMGTRGPQEASLVQLYWAYKEAEKAANHAFYAWKKIKHYNKFDFGISRWNTIRGRAGNSKQTLLAARKRLTTLFNILDKGCDGKTDYPQVFARIRADLWGSEKY